MRPRATCAMLLAAAALAATGCDRGGEVDRPTPIERVAERGPVALRVTVDRPEPVVGDTVGLTIEVTAEPGIAVTMPRLESPLGAFEIRSTHLPPDVPDGDGKRRLWRHRYELQTFAAGAHEIDSIVVPFVDPREGGEPIEATVAVDAIELTVRSALDPALADAADAPALRDPVPVSGERARANLWLIAAVVAAMLVCVAVAAFVVTRLLRPGPTIAAAEPVIPAHEWALEQLRQLAERRLLEDGHFHA